MTARIKATGFLQLRSSDAHHSGYAKVLLSVS
jgi:hypothetical protein